MQLTKPAELGLLILEARRKQRLSQSDLAGKAGVSRQWLSMVENGKTTIEFDLAFHVLRTLGYVMRIEERGQDDPGIVRPRPDLVIERSKRTRLTRRSRPLSSGTGRPDTTG